MATTVRMSLLLMRDNKYGILMMMKMSSILLEKKSHRALKTKRSLSLINENNQNIDIDRHESISAKLVTIKFQVIIHTDKRNRTFQNTQPGAK